MNNLVSRVCPLMSSANNQAGCVTNCMFCIDGECAVNIIAKALVCLANTQTDQQQGGNSDSANPKSDRK